MREDEQALLQERIAGRLGVLRAERGWSLDELAARSGVSRASLARLEKGETSPTTQVLARIAAAYGLTLTRIIHLAEAQFAPLVTRAEQPVYVDAALGFHRRSISPPAPELRAEMLECRIEPGREITYDRAPRADLEHHLFLLAGALEMQVDGVSHCLAAGDCLRFRLAGASRFRTPPESGAHYILVLV
ncbi:helix-turn-helix domain-containing protein [Rhabdaerophilum calidifontis]|uniref:helix-turn-helix domain-containing protein n=1 Tax=Rhabdaerophilum calidifontis TaxID=2604328 RepID=UPI00123A10A0|nr:XRE family transcriptional regulator [Rhabdaerophilum calidifontis]